MTGKALFKSIQTLYQWSKLTEIVNLSEKSQLSYEDCVPIGSGKSYRIHPFQSKKYLNG